MNKLRITSGEYRGLTITTPGEGTHPMGARERLALFNMISRELSNASLMDAFSGSGALGIEALSRGAERVTFVEKNPKACQVIKTNLAKIGSRKNTKVIKGDVYGMTGQFDVVIADPPYDQYNATKIQVLARLVKPEGILVLSHPGELPLMPEMELETTRQYAEAHLSVYKKR